MGLSWQQGPLSTGAVGRFLVPEPLIAGEVRRLVRALPNGHSYVCYAKPGPNEKMGEDFDAVGRLTRSVFESVGVSSEADVYLSGPNRFIGDMTKTLKEIGVAPECTHFEVFSASEGHAPAWITLDFVTEIETEGRQCRTAIALPSRSMKHCPRSEPTHLAISEHVSRPDQLARPLANHVR